MLCPIDGTQLVMADRQGVEIDYCPQCRGVWLDRGELDKIIERSGAASAPPPPPASQHAPQAGPQAARPAYREDHGRDYDDRRYGEQGYRKKRKGFLDELFDF
jgi:Zn-finger nucleic acid-binding protein